MLPHTAVFDPSQLTRLSRLGHLDGASQATALGEDISIESFSEASQMALALIEGPTMMTDGAAGGSVLQLQSSIPFHLRYHAATSSDTEHSLFATTAIPPPSLFLYCASTWRRVETLAASGGGGAALLTAAVPRGTAELGPMVAFVTAFSIFVATLGLLRAVAQTDSIVSSRGTQSQRSHS